jgi:Tat protein secretion system quality control protein TatD with DNase activity
MPADLLELLSNIRAPPNAGGILHCFRRAGLPRRGLALGFHISFAAHYSRRPTTRGRWPPPPPEPAGRDRLPYQIFAPHRGRRNEPPTWPRSSPPWPLHRRTPAEMAGVTAANFKPVPQTLRRMI